jgi:hypothetical protein
MAGDYSNTAGGELEGFTYCTYFGRRCIAELQMGTVRTWGEMAAGWLPTGVKTLACCATR